MRYEVGRVVTSVIPPRSTSAARGDPYIASPPISGQPVRAGVYLRKTLRPGDTLNGPALILEPQTTTFVSRDFRARVDANGTLVLTQEERV